MQGKIYCVIRMVERLVCVSRVQIRGIGRGASLQVLSIRMIDQRVLL